MKLVTQATAAMTPYVCVRAHKMGGSAPGSAREGEPSGATRSPGGASTPAGRRCLDVGASTGGFTDCLLKRGAAHVVALDVAYGELDWGLRNDPRVTVVERANARAVEPRILPYAPEVVVVDVSFISLLKVLPPVLEASAPEFDCLALVKPQFEVGRERVGKGGVVRSAEARRDGLASVGRGMAEEGWAVLGFASSG